MTLDSPAPRLLRVTTQAGTVYELDLEGRRLRRLPGATARTGPVGSADLRRDGDWLRLLALPAVVVGEPAEFLLEPLGDPETVVFTTRLTTPVVAIEPVEATA